MLRLFVITSLSWLLLACAPAEPENNYVIVDGEFIAHRTVTLSIQGPEASEARETFLNYDVSVTFTQNDESITVLAYFTGDGDAANSSASSGNIWRAHFVPFSDGAWDYTVSFKQGKDVALNGGGTLVEGPDGASGSFAIDAAEFDSSATDFAAKGMLQDVRGRYLQFSGSKDYFLKTGAGSPENILAYADFDGTYDVGGQNFPALGEDQLHAFEPHLRDAQPGDPTWQNSKGASLLGIANYYAEVGVNAQYLVSMNIEGDGQDVFPWVAHDDPYVFDVSKLDQWRIVFEHFNRRGVLIDMLVTETENESLFEAWDGVTVGEDFADSRKLYYREMVARFGHLYGIVWNLGEENGVVGNSGKDPYRQPTSPAQRLDFADYIASIDPYEHAIVNHNWPDSEKATYGPKLGAENFSGISLQAHHHYAEKTIAWTAKSDAAGRGWMVTVDEPLGWEYGAHPDSDGTDYAREIEGVLWPSFMAGSAGVDWYFGWQNNAPTSDLSNEDQRSRHNVWVKSAKVRHFFEDNFDLSSMTAEMDGVNIITRGQTLEGKDFILTATRSTPVIPEGEGHNPWEYVLEGLTLEIDGEVTEIESMNPIFP